MFVREKRIKCGKNYLEVDIIPILNLKERAARGKYQKEKKVTQPKQMDLNDKNSKRYLTQLANGNFTDDDYHITCTYSDEFLPDDIEEAKKDARNYLRRISQARKRTGLEPLKYILVTEHGEDKETGEIKRVHHHIIINGGLTRDELENLWSKRKKKIGFVNADRLQLNENGLEALCKYLTKNPQGKKRWSSSRNLKRPMQRNNDYKYTDTDVYKMEKAIDRGYAAMQKKYKNYEITSIEYVENKRTKYTHVYLKMWKKNKGAQRYE